MQSNSLFLLSNYLKIFYTHELEIDEPSKKSQMLLLPFNQRLAKVASCFYQISNPGMLLTYTSGLTIYKNYINFSSENQTC